MQRVDRYPGGLGVGEMSKSYCSPHLTKHTVCQVKADAKVPRWGLEVNFPLRTLKKFESFFAEHPEALIA